MNAIDEGLSIFGIISVVYVLPVASTSTYEPKKVRAELAIDADVGCSHRRSSAKSPSVRQAGLN